MICPHCGKETEERTVEAPVIERDAEGRMVRWSEITRDAKGKAVRERVDEYAYGDGGAYTIRQKVIEGKDLAVDREIEHFSDGRAPEVREKKIDEAAAVEAVRR